MLEITNVIAELYLRKPSEKFEKCTFAYKPLTSPRGEYKCTTLAASFDMPSKDEPTIAITEPLWFHCALVICTFVSSSTGSAKQNIKTA